MDVAVRRNVCEPEGPNWVRIAAGGSLFAGGFAAIDQQETVKSVWNALPGYIDQVQHMLGKVEETVAEVAAQRERLHEILTRSVCVQA
jgi:hypothetical protein